ncbi:MULTISPECIES: cation diffusion facilitator family transporter [unclassified Actinomyces]|uniref:cation diffusion facilitator family transporter n=1 Tax=unclassified Actinomyces TaxID=2609248 RepID=UPI0020174C0D|nr:MULTISPECIES: cation diffusion facilitator family transporter [unclassified Actinomyces]MCL3777715.1 cation transporter [Actinomyces sp. AC-20-1]MCL3789843.1 cation transporter [Actinomyces sp. 187325]MCL3791515.1 cation transporter [Actinomyces sp. 186855]MCL3793832.1 cation transporter [Actinomyces sp. 217892]
MSGHDGDQRVTHDGDGTGGRAQCPSHPHTHAAASSTTRLAVVLALTATVLAAEVVAALLSGSLALLADAGHMATDSAGVVIALAAAVLARRPASDRSTWGMRRAEVIGAALQAGMLSVVGLVVAVRAVIDLVRPSEVAAAPMLVMGVIGLAANAAALLVLAGGRGESLNMRAAFLEVANDALGSVGVVVAAIVIALTGWQRADAVASLLIVVLIVPRAVSLLHSAGSVLMDLTPQDLDLGEVRRHLTGLDGVVAVHDLHAWTVASGLPVLTAHVVVTDERYAAGATDDLLRAMQSCVAEHFPVRIAHSTFQIEPAGHREPGSCA